MRVNDLVVRLSLVACTGRTTILVEALSKKRLLTLTKATRAHLISAVVACLTCKE